MWRDKQFKGSYQTLSIPTIDYNLSSSYRKRISSVNVTKGCTLQLFKQYKGEELLGTFVEDMSELPEDVDDEALSVSCTCNPGLLFVCLFE